MGLIQKQIPAKLLQYSSRIYVTTKTKTSDGTFAEKGHESSPLSASEWFSDLGD
jgi:hypothetical protein